MPIRNRHRRGVHLVRDEESDFVHYSDEIVRRYDGALVLSTQYEGRHPQEFIRAKNDPYPVDPISDDPIHDLAGTNIPSINIGNTTIVTQPGIVGHIYRATKQNMYLIGIGEMIIDDPGDSGFVVD